MRREVPHDDWIASCRFLFVGADGAERTVTARIGRPYDTGQGDWACPVETEGYRGRGSDIVGLDSLQALSLGLSYVRMQIEGFIEGGGRILDPEQRTEWSTESIASLFGSVGSAKSV